MSEKIEDILTLEKFTKIAGNQGIPFYPHILKFCEQYEINTVLRLSGFLAQAGHETQGFTRVRENLNYSASGLMNTFKKYFPNVDIARDYAGQPERIGNRVYANRLGNSNEKSGDGYLYSGRGIFQLTGKENYERCGSSIKKNLVDSPDSVLQHEIAVESACWFWNSRSLNSFADRKDIRGMTIRINGGLNGIDDRTQRYNIALFVLSDGSEELTGAEQQAFLDNIDPAVTTSMNYTPNPPASQDYITENRTTRGQYPYNAVHQSRSGHITEIDDTPGQERLNLMHKAGSYTETVADGTVTRKSVTDRYDLTLRDLFEHIGGSVTRTVVGMMFQKVGAFVVDSLATIFLKAGVQIQLNSPLVSFSDLLVGKQSDIEQGHFEDLAVDNVIDGTAMYANYINYDGDHGGFDMRAFADSMQVSSTQDPTWLKAPNHKEGMALNDVPMRMIVKETTQGDYSYTLAYFDKKSDNWKSVSDNTIVTP